MPPRMKNKGRPKGNGFTVIGLPKKVNNGKPTPFIKKSEWEKSKCKYKWIGGYTQKHTAN